MPPLPANGTNTHPEEPTKDVPEMRWRDEKKEESTVQEAKGDNTTGDSKEESDDPTKRLENLTGEDVNRWMKELMPPGTKCMFVVSLTVAPEWQGQGIGSAFLKWGAENADKAGVFCWVHSSEAAWTTYAKAGFKVVGALDVDLDEYAIGPPPRKELEVSKGKWGHYVFRYMKRLPR